MRPNHYEELQAATPTAQQNPAPTKSAVPEPDIPEAQAKTPEGVVAEQSGNTVTLVMTTLLQLISSMFGNKNGPQPNGPEGTAPQDDMDPSNPDKGPITPEQMKQLASGLIMAMNGNGGPDVLQRLVQEMASQIGPSQKPEPKAVMDQERTAEQSAARAEEEQAAPAETPEAEASRPSNPRMDRRPGHRPAPGP